MVEWNSGMEWNGHAHRALSVTTYTQYISSRVKASHLYRECLKKLGSIDPAERLEE